MGWTLLWSCVSVIDAVNTSPQFVPEAQWFNPNEHEVEVRSFMLEHNGNLESILFKTPGVWIIWDIYCLRLGAHILDLCAFFLPGRRTWDALDLFGAAMKPFETLWRHRGFSTEALDIMYGMGAHDILTKEGWFFWLSRLLELCLGFCRSKSYLFYGCFQI